MGIFIGVQFLLGTLGGLYFSWTDIEEIRGEHLRNEVKTVSRSADLVSPNIALSEIGQESAKVKIIQLIEVLGKPLYAIVLTTESGKEVTFVAAATTGKVESFRTNKWRSFDFLWMLHTMDYNGRDNLTITSCGRFRYSE